jgi:hypothetical protein
MLLCEADKKGGSVVMKKFVLPLLFVVAAGMSVFALPIYEDPNVAWIVSPAGSPGWLTVMNAGDASASFLRIAAASEIAIEGAGFVTIWDGTYLTAFLPAAVGPAGHVVTVKLLSTGGSAIDLTSAELGVFGAPWTAVADGTSAAVTVLNAGQKDAKKVVINSYTYMAEAVEGFDTVLVQAGGAQMVITLATPLAPGARLTFKLGAAGDQAVHVQSVALY